MIKPLGSGQVRFNR